MVSTRAPGDVDSLCSFNSDPAPNVRVLMDSHNYVRLLPNGNDNTQKSTWQQVDLDSNNKEEGNTEV